MRALALIGPPGAGKTAVGRLVAERRGVRFADLDESVAARHGDLDEFVLDNGAALLAERTLDVLRDELSVGGVVAVSSLVTGGEAAYAVLVGADVVYLASDLAHTFGRSGMNAPQPPSMFGARARWKELLDARDPGYRRLATAVVDVGELDIAGVADAVESALHG
ncbi:MAG TPA: shikimate kinase [Actinomycetaceae bacterium]|nr:shikimate kinase [Actinomycetaceae bacterium]